jgi:hypothetical protein
MRSFPWVEERFFKKSGHGLGANILRLFLSLDRSTAYVTCLAPPVLVRLGVSGAFIAQMEDLLGSQRLLDSA